MNKEMDNYRTMIAGFMSGLLGWLQPIAGDIFTMIFVFILNFVAGYFAGRIKGEDFNLDKAIKCLFHAFIFFGLVGSIYLIGKLKQQEEGAIQCVSTVVWVLIYFYGTNILRNIRQMLDSRTTAYKVIDFLYYLLSFEVIKKIPVLGDYLERKEEGEEIKEKN